MTEFDEKFFYNSFMGNLKSFDPQIVENVLSKLDTKNIQYFKRLDKDSDGTYYVIEQKNVNNARLVVIDEIHNFYHK